MANLVTFAKKLWKDKVGGNTPITAAELNRIEGGVNDCATQINKLGDSVSLIHVFYDKSGKTNLVITFSSGRMNAVVFTDNNGTGNLTYVSRDSSKTIAGEDSLVSVDASAYKATLKLSKYSSGVVIGQNIASVCFE